jgi:hypothetical protein
LIPIKRVIALSAKAWLPFLSAAMGARDGDRLAAGLGLSKGQVGDQGEGYFGFYGVDLQGIEWIPENLAALLCGYNLRRPVFAVGWRKASSGKHCFSGRCDSSETHVSVPLTLGMAGTF